MCSAGGAGRERSGRARETDREERAVRRSDDRPRDATVVGPEEEAFRRHEAVDLVAALDVGDVVGRDAVHAMSRPRLPAVGALGDVRGLAAGVEGERTGRRQSPHRDRRRLDGRPGSSAVGGPGDAAAPGGETGGRAEAQQIGDRAIRPPRPATTAVGGRENVAVREGDVTDLVGGEGEGFDPRGAANVARSERKAAEVLASVVGAAERTVGGDDHLVGRATGEADSAEVEREPGDDSRPGGTAVGALEQSPEVARGVARRAAARDVAQGVRAEERVTGVPARLRRVHSGGGGRENRQRRDGGDREAGEEAHRPAFLDQGARRSSSSKE